MQLHLYSYSEPSSKIDRVDDNKKMKTVNMPRQINSGPCSQSYTCTRKLLKRLALLSFLLTITASPASAQAPTTISSTSPTFRSTSTSPTSPITSLTVSSRFSAISTSSPRPSAKASMTTSSSTFPSAIQSGPTNFPTNSNSGPLPNANTNVDRDISQYYYIIILAAALVLAAIVWLLHRRRRRRKMASRTSRHSALARDLQGLPAHRRWLHGAWRGSDNNARREEGLDERGEAPPPYKRADDMGSCSATSESEYRGESSHGSENISIPLHTYHPDTTDRLSQKPPEYGQVVRRVDPADVSTEPSSNGGDASETRYA